MDMQNNSRAAELRLYLKSRMSSMPYRGLIRDIYVSEDKDGKSLEVDGDYGENTAYAVERLQRDAGMSGIWFGTMSSKTWELLLA